MIGYLQGEILEYADGRMMVTLGDKSFGCLGYLVSVPQRASYGAFLSNQKIELYIYTHVREDSLDLFGFTTKFEKEIFLILLGVNGVGPKSALGILSKVDPSQLCEAILKADQAFLTQIPGIGKKTAERVVVELKDTIRKKLDSGSLSKPLLSEQTQRSGGGIYSVMSPDMQSSVFQDAKSALLSLGYREQDIHQLLNRILENTEVEPRRAEDLIRTALRQLG